MTSQCLNRSGSRSGCCCDSGCTARSVRSCVPRRRHHGGNRSTLKSCRFKPRKSGRSERCRLRSFAGAPVICHRLIKRPDAAVIVQIQRERNWRGATGQVPASASPELLRRARVVVHRASLLATKLLNPIAASFRWVRLLRLAAASGRKLPCPSSGRMSARPPAQRFGSSKRCRLVSKVPCEKR